MEVWALFVSLLAHALDQRVEADRAEVTVAVVAYGDGLRIDFLVAHHQHVGGLGEFRVADLAPHGLGAVVDAGPQPAAAQPYSDFGRALVVPVGDRQDDRLHGREPEREATAV